ncbi:hypothetical protein TNCV_3713151 [Trichonephila clavipes]|nr:hypothetical protein TNCV_3713151 [Trichonephila clavipes]
MAFIKTVSTDNSVCNGAGLGQRNGTGPCSLTNHDPVYLMWYRSGGRFNPVRQPCDSRRMCSDFFLRKVSTDRTLPVSAKALCKMYFFGSLSAVEPIEDGRRPADQKT